MPHAAPALGHPHGGSTRRHHVAARDRRPLRRTRVRLPIAIALVGTMASVTLPAQQDPPASGGGFVFRSRAELVNVTATVKDRNERFVTGLERDDFVLYEDGAPQPITHFSDERVPVSLGLVVDTSGSMEGEKWLAARDAIERFQELLGPEDEVFLYTFSDDTQLVEPWTRDRNRISRAMARVQPRGGTSMYDAVAEAIPIAQEGVHQKKALIVISDGNDRNSSTDPRSLRQLIRETEVLVYAIGIDGESEQPTWTRPMPRTPRLPIPFPIPGRRYPPQWPGSPPPRYPRGGTVGGADEGVNVGALRDLTDDSGGRTEVVRSARDLGPATAGIADELSRQYSLAYVPAAEKDGRWHTIRVEVRGRDYLVRARRGYVATP
ncbi:MAG TPA: VWA domain-containing protein [Vicinamibacterales bacterium]